MGLGNYELQGVRDLGKADRAVTGADWIEAMMDGVREEVMELGVVVAWLLWFHRTSVVFESELWNAHGILDKADNILKDYQVLSKHRRLLTGFHYLINGVLRERIDTKLITTLQFLKKLIVLGLVLLWTPHSVTLSNMGNCIWLTGNEVKDLENVFRKKTSE